MSYFPQLINQVGHTEKKSALSESQYGEKSISNQNYANNRERNLPFMLWAVFR